MVKTGARASALALLLERIGRSVTPSRPPSPRITDLSPEHADGVVALFEGLGGHKGSIDRLRPGGWDLALADGVIVELDEELHFNRYRQLTLQSAWAQALPWTTAYRELCASHEAQCLRAAQWGKRWTNPSCEVLFGAPAPAGDLDGAGGAPRWKQRALYDAMKDAFAAGSSIQLARLSVHDVVGDLSLEAVLRYPSKVDLDALKGLIEARTA